MESKNPDGAQNAIVSPISKNFGFIFVEAGSKPQEKIVITIKKASRKAILNLAFKYTVFYPAVIL
ncbi:hypothetical protein N9S34_01965 [bacterium]|nr:hypothetical protein [bacterium]